MIWVHSTSKAARDTNARQAKVEAGLAAIEAVAERLSSPKSRLRTKVAAEEAAVAALATAGASRFVGFVVNEEQEEAYFQERRGRPGADTRYRKRVKTVFNIEETTWADQIAYDAATDGCFPLVTNADELSPAEVLEVYRYQPNLECRNHMQKGPQAVAPVFIEHPHRIEAILLCHFLAMLAEALIEREIRTSMKAEGLRGVPLYPELRNCPSPSAPRILEIFGDAQRHRLMSKGERSCRSSTPSSRSSSSRSSTFSTSPPASMPRRATPEAGADMGHEKCGTSESARDIDDIFDMELIWFEMIYGTVFTGARRAFAGIPGRGSLMSAAGAAWCLRHRCRSVWMTRNTRNPSEKAFRLLLP